MMNIQNLASNKKLQAALLGLLTLAVTPVIAVVASLCLAWVQGISGLSTIEVIANLFRLESLGGFFAAHLILINILNLLGNLVISLISWLLYRTWRLALITFVSAFIFQTLLIIMAIPSSLQQTQETMRRGIEREQAYQQYARIGSVRFQVGAPYSTREIDNTHPEYGAFYKSLQIIVPINVKQTGNYAVYVRYQFAKAGERGGTPLKSVTGFFKPGAQTLKIEFLANEIRGYGFWSPDAVYGVTEIQLFYLASKQSLLEEIKKDQSVNPKIREQFMRDEKLYDKAINPDATVRKLVERKEVNF